MSSKYPPLPIIPAPMMSSQSGIQLFHPRRQCPDTGIQPSRNLIKNVVTIFYASLLVSDLDPSVSYLDDTIIKEPVSATFMTPSLVDSNQNVGTVVASNYYNTYLQNNLWFAKRRIYLLHFR
ncbi:hypothetical protein [Wolbachia endosymbiont (group A) of Brachyopa scutellaris]|uniref:hypothetical protein n=1 Tax=Wolbachia endosymbiont (group A) of Brachyopa scutellaris TaxID=3066140 RepID=UPI0031329CDF